MHWLGTYIMKILWRPPPWSSVSDFPLTLYHLLSHTRCSIRLLIVNFNCKREISKQTSLHICILVYISKCLWNISSYCSNNLMHNLFKPNLLLFQILVLFLLVYIFLSYKKTNKNGAHFRREFIGSYNWSFQ